MSSTPMYPSKSEAIATGSLFYSSGKPCRKGHESKRYTKTGHCFHCSLEKATEWQKNNRERHNEFVATWDKTHYESHRAEYYKKHRQNKLSDIDYLMKERYDKSKRRAKEKGWDFDLTIDYLKSIYPVDNRCPVFGFEFDLTRQDLQRVPSLDRIDNTKGYVQGNVHFISYRANSIKQDSTRDELRMLLEYLDQL